MILPVEGAIAPASAPYQRTDIHVLGSEGVNESYHEYCDYISSRNFEDIIFTTRIIFRARDECL